MEILQTIWNVLTTENELLVNIVSIPLAFIEAYLSMLIFTTLLNIANTKKQRLIFTLSFSTLSLLNKFIIAAPYNNFINIIIMPILVFFIFKTTILKSILSEIINYIVAFIIIVPLILLYSFIFNISSEATNIIPLHKICFSIINYAILYLFNVLCVRFKIIISLVDRFKYKVSFLLILNFVVGSIAICIVSYLLFAYINVLPNMLIISCTLILFLYFVLTMFSLIRTNKLEITTQNLEEQKLYNKTLATLHDNIRGFKHDFNNIIQAIGGYLSTDNIDGLKIYYKDLLDECQINNNLSVLNPELINNPVIYSLLADKYYKSEKLDIKLNLEVLTDLSNLNIKSYELTRILGVLLDNAIEAAAKCTKKFINISFRRDRNKDLIIIQNSYVNKDIDINKIYEKGYTSKNDTVKDSEHGLGLWEVRKYLKKNTHLDLYTTKTDEYFSQQFEIYN